MIAAAAMLLLASAAAADDFSTWGSYLGDPGRSHYSSLAQINAANVAQLQIAWRYDSGDARDGSQIQCNPIIVDGVLYATSPRLSVFALDAASGRQLWRFDPFAGRPHGQGINRGVAFWRAGGEARILFTAGPWLYALDAHSGQPAAGFGDAGRVDFRAGLGRDPATLQVDATSPGAIYRDLIVLGSRVGETPGAAPGHIRAFDVRSGALAWVFHTIPQPGELGYSSWPADAWRRVGGGNSWAGMSVDHRRGLVFASTGSPAYDFYGADRPGDNLFANSVIALEAATGKYRWHFQTVRHDLWDRDLPAPPNLVTLRRGGGSIDALAQVTKSGWVFVLDRDTGRPLYPVEERAVPASEMAGEAAAPTQPFPTLPPPFTRQSFGPDQITDISAESRREVLERLAELRNGPPYLPPSDLKATVLFPGFDGGAHWGGAGYDPQSGYLYVTASELPWTYQLVKVPAGGDPPGEALYRQHCASCHGMDRGGNGKDFPSLNGVGQRLSYPQIAGVIRAGRGRMPGSAQLSFAQLLQLLDYLNLAESEPSPAEQPSPGPTSYLHSGYFPFYDRDGYPAIKPPWGTLTAIDLNHGRIAWQVPLGEYPELVKRGIRNTGTENYGGPLVTRGGLVFVAATMDEKFRAFDQSSGRLLWETTLPAAGFATPASYAVNGRQYVVIAAGGGKSGRKSSGQYIAFALSDPIKVP